MRRKLSSEEDYGLGFLVGRSPFLGKTQTIPITQYGETASLEEFNAYWSVYPFVHYSETLNLSENSSGSTKERKKLSKLLLSYLKN